MSNRALIIAHLNLNAVLQNLEELVQLDPEMTQLTKNWDIAIQFSVARGPAAYLVFRQGRCTHGTGNHPNPTVKLLFLSPAHLNRMFDGKGIPIPLKGFGRLGFLNKEFAKLTGRLEHYLKPQKGADHDRGYIRINTILTLQTAVFAVKELAALEPTCKQVAAHTPNGVVQLEVLPQGPYAHLIFQNGSVVPRKGPAETPMAKMTFKDLDAAHRLLQGELDAFLAVAEQDVMLCGQIPLIDNLNLILDRVQNYLE